MNSWVRMVVLMAMFPLCSCSGHEEPVLHKPSDISSRITDSVMTYVHRGEISSQEDYNTTRDRFARLLADSMLADSLDRREKYKRAKILFWSDSREQAKTILIELGQVEDELTPEIEIQLITMEIEDEAWDDAEDMMKEYRVNHPPYPDAPATLRMSVDDLAGRYNNNDRPEDAIRVFLDEIDHLPFDYPYSSFSLMEELVPLMIETGRTSEMKELLIKARESFTGSLKIHVALPAPQDSTYEDYEKLTKAFEIQIEQFVERTNRCGHSNRPHHSLCNRRRTGHVLDWSL